MIKKQLFKLTLLLVTYISLAQQNGKTITLLDTNLSHFQKWNGIPHSSVKGLPEGTYQSNNITKGTPLGLNNDLKNTFTIITENNELVLKVTGEIYGALTTKASYQNYHLSVMFKWGDKKWAPRLKTKRDNGIIYHSYGEYGRFWKTWKSGLEYQIQETDIGDYVGLGDEIDAPQLDIRGTIKQL